jgi:serine/threonine protein kinase
MAPEMVTKDGHTEAVDWWSLGVAIFMMVRAQFTVLGVAMLRFTIVVMRSL